MSTETMTEQPVFNSYQEALLFAYNYADQQFAKSLMARMMSSTGSARGLVGLDGAGEAGMIMASVRKLSQIEQDVLCVRYTKVKSFCKCCGHEVNTPQVRDALSRLEAFIQGDRNTQNKPSKLEAYKLSMKEDSTDSEPNNIVQFSKKEDEDEKIKGVINLSNLSLIRSIICEYFGLSAQIDIKEIASKHDVHRNTVSKYSSLIKKQLRMIERETENKICSYLEEDGKVIC